MKVYLSLLLVLVCCLTKSFAQDKFEKESRIKKAQVPATALNFIKAAGFSQKIKWYKEESLVGYSYEAKTIDQGRKYSVEFDSLGKIEDIEYKISWAVIPPLAKAKIEAYFDRKYQKKKIVKVQVQVSGPSPNLIQWIKDKKTPPEITTKYELVIKGSKAKQSQMMEYLFTEAGTVERASKIVLKNTDHLEY